VTLVLVHSAGATPAIWDRVRRHLTGVPVLTPTLPGRDGTGTPTVDVAEHAAAVLRAMDVADVARATIGGHSLGGAVALWLAIHARDRVAGIGVANASARMRVHPQMLAALPGGLNDMSELIATSNFTPGAPQEWIDERRAAYERVGGETLLADLTACDRFDVLDRLWEIRCRTQILAGSEDALAPPKHARTMAERISAARIIEYAGAGHMLPIERPAEVAGELAVLWAAGLDGASTRGRGGSALPAGSGRAYPPAG
jgi:3-oxoadipate enol-lactonase/4-carboxymuconolactone decarboxylase